MAKRRDHICVYTICSMQIQSIHIKDNPTRTQQKKSTYKKQKSCDENDDSIGAAASGDGNNNSNNITRLLLLLLLLKKKGMAYTCTHKNGKQNQRNLGYEAHDVVIHELNSHEHRIRPKHIQLLFSFQFFISFYI